jgi:sulfoxide reductase heme-binding subunit YedZ
VSVFAAAGPSPYWYLTRGTGAVTLLLLTASVVLGIAGSVRFAAPRWPRFAIDTIHRDVSLLVIALLVVHIITSVLDSFAPIRIPDAVIPFVGVYRPLWLGLGALSFDILIALAVTSLLRRRFGFQVWRTVHWLAYVSWPVAILHGLGTGSDSKVWWMLGLTAVCVAAVVVAVLIRIGSAEDESELRRGGLVALTIATPIALAVFTLAGPLQKGWARRAGTPSTLLAKSVPAAARISAPAKRVSAAHGSTSAPTLKTPFEAQLTGTVSQSQAPGGAVVDIAMHLSGGAKGRLRVRLAGTPSNGGGLSMTGSQVDLLASGLLLEGRVTSLEGTQFVARVAGGGSTVELHANLSIDQSSGSVTGTVSGNRTR